MDDFNTKSYYALLWNTSLDLGREMKIKGRVLCNDSRLPDDPRILYGANMNDVARVRKSKLWKKIEYDVRTTQQKVVYWNDLEEYTFQRDVRVVVWTGNDTLWLPYDNYKIVTPEHFSLLADVSSNFEEEIEEDEYVNPKLISNWDVYTNPKDNFEGDILDKMLRESEVEHIDTFSKGNNVNIIKSEKIVESLSLLGDLGWATS